MSQFAAALEIVINRLDGRRAAGYTDWRASRASLERLLAAPGVEGTDDKGGSTVSWDGAPPGARDGRPTTGKADRLTQLRADQNLLPCAECPYGQTAPNHVVFGVGNSDAELMFIGEAPGAEEDLQGEPFVGRAGQLLTKMIATMGYQRGDIYIANILKCRPDTPGQTAGNRAPTAGEMASCRPCLFAQIEIIRPKAIVALGATAMRGLLDVTEPIGKLRGHWHDFRGIPVMATYHPSYLLRNQAPAERRKVWEDLLEVKTRLGHVLTERDRSYFLTKG